jgi:hypothetical protein
MGMLPSWFTVQIALAPMPLPFFHALRDIEIETSIGAASAFRLHFDLSRSFLGDFDALAFDIFRPMFPIRISVAGGLPIPQTIINGFITDTKLDVGDAPGTSRLEVVGMDALATVMSNNQQPFPWPNLSDGTIATAVFMKYIMIPMVDPMPPTRTMMDTTTNQRDYDARFLMQLAHANGLELYVQPDPLIGKDVGHLHRPLFHLPHQGVLSTDFGRQTNLTSFKVTNNALKPTGIMGASVDQRTRAPIPVAGNVSTDVPMGREPALLRVLPPPLRRQLESGIANPTEAYKRAFAKTSASSRAISVRGDVDGLKFARPLRAGLPVMVRGAGNLNSGLYYVDSVTHRISRDAYQQSFTGWRNAVGMTGAEVFIDPLAPAA